MVAKWQHVTYVESDSEPGKRHEIKRRGATLGCSCTAYRFSSPKGCKHLTAFCGGPDTARAMVAVANAASTRADALPARATVGAETFTFRRAISFDGSLGA